MGRNVDRRRHSTRKRIFEFRPKAFWKCNGGGGEGSDRLDLSEKSVAQGRIKKGRKEGNGMVAPSHETRPCIFSQQKSSLVPSRIGLLEKYLLNIKRGWNERGDGCWSRPNFFSFFYCSIFFQFLSSGWKGQSSQEKLFDLKISWTADLIFDEFFFYRALKNHFCLSCVFRNT